MKNKEREFRFKVGEIVKHKIREEPFFVLLRQRTEGITGVPLNWYLCRIPGMAEVLFSEIELEKL